MEHLSKIYFQQEDLIRRNSLQQTLCIQVLTDHCRILITDEEKNVLLLEERSHASFLRKEWPFVNLRFAETRLLACPDSFIFVPKEFESSGNENTFDSFLNAGSPRLEAKVQGTNITNLFTVDTLLEQYQAIFLDSKIVPSANVSISHLLPLSKGNESTVGIHLYPDGFEMVYLKDEEFIFYNRFPKENADDFNYYLLAVFDQFGIQAAHTHFYLTGNVFESDENYARVQKYSTYLHLASAQNWHSFPEQIDGQLKHSFFLLTELSTCEL